jgi:phosphoribosylformylglycinamidine cyclo-ligase
MNYTYKDAGVDIDAGNRAVELMKTDVRRTFRPEVLTDLGGFAGLFALDNAKYREPVLLAGTDGVGTKIKLAMEMDKHDTIGIDAVAMCVNDILSQGAEPLFFLDYIAVGELKPQKVADIVHGVADGCLQAGCALIGGETAEMPGLYAPDEYDIAGFAVGIAEKNRLVTGANIVDGDIVIGLPSSGVHSNGFSLVRKIFFDKNHHSLDEYFGELGGKLGETLLIPTRIYVKDLLPLLNDSLIKGMAHITGGGLLENIPRILPDRLGVELDSTTWEISPIFNLMQELGGVAKEEMHRVFNMGIGMVLVTDAHHDKEVLSRVPDSRIIGKIKAGEKVVNLL